MLQIKNQSLTSISNRLYFCAIRNNISSISSKNFKIIHQPFVVKKSLAVTMRAQKSLANYSTRPIQVLSQ